MLGEVSGLVQKHFYDPKLRGLDWNRELAIREQRAEQAKTWGQVSTLVNDLLATLKASHTSYFSPESRGYHDLMGVFGQFPRHEDYRRRSVYEGAGLDVQDGFIIGVLDGSPAQTAGLLTGDKVLSVDGQPFHEILSFRGKKKVKVEIQRSPGAAPRSFDVNVTREPSAERYMSALKKSARVIPSGGKKIAYVHVWSYAGRAYHEALSDLLSDAPLEDADALVLDVRGGWGGANPDFLNLFNKNVPLTRMIERSGGSHRMDQQWRKPVVLLVDRGSRSGKEILAFGFKRYRIGPVVGERTAGAVLGGRLIPLKSGGALYLAVVDVDTEGERLEGVGVIPDVEVARPIPYSQGADPQLDEAVRQAAKISK